MAINIFLQLPSPFGGAIGQPVKVAGESQDQAHQNWIDVQEFQIGAISPVTIGSSTTGAGTAKLKFNEVQIKKKLDASSAGLYATLAGGAHFQKMTLAVHAGTAKTDYLKYDFSLALVTSINWDGTDDVVETVTFAIGAMQVSYWVQNTDGTLAASPLTGVWSQVTNTATLTVPGN